MNFRYRHNTSIRMGNGIIMELPKLLTDMAFRRPVMVVDNNFLKSAINEAKATDYEPIYVHDGSEPSYELLDRIKGKFRNKDYDCIVAVGGGSTMDLAKGLAVLATNPGPAINYKGFPVLKNNPLPVITIPTLPGTGSEIAFNAVFTDTKTKTRLGINTEKNYPVLTLVDPDLAKTAPKNALTSSLMDCMCHAISSYISPGASPFTKMLAKEAVKQLIEATDKEPFDYEKLYLASMMANMSLNNAGCGLEGSFSGPLGALFGVPHGIGEGIFLPYLIKFYINKGFEGFNELFDCDEKLDVEDLIDDFYLGIQAPEDLNKYLSGKDIPKIISAVENNFKECPVKFTKADCEKMLKKYVTRMT
jgi:alcohol dehydrogenase class IV